MRSDSPGFCCTACCNAEAAWEGGGRGGFWACATTASPSTSAARREERGALRAGAERAAVPRSELLRSPCSVIMCCLPPRARRERGDNMGANCLSVKRLKRERGAWSRGRPADKRVGRAAVRNDCGFRPYLWATLLAAMAIGHATARHTIIL